jgi:predicted RNase H-like nuclease
MAIVAGIDGCRGGWLCLTKDLVTGKVCVRILERIGDLRCLKPRPKVVTIDVPIGLTDSGPRVCDLQARALLKLPRSCSVFPAPIRPVLTAKSYVEACQLGLKADGRKLNRQTWAIMPKIVEVDACLSAHPTLQRWIREVHPEVCFCAWNNNVAMVHRKKSSDGRAEREVLVEPRYGKEYQAARSSLPRGQYSNNDLLDAFAALWTAERVAAESATVLPANPPLDSHGLRMEIVA